MEFELLTGQTIGMLVMDFALVFAVLLLVRVLYGVASGVDTLHEISVKDNFAIGISLAGSPALPCPVRLAVKNRSMKTARRLSQVTFFRPFCHPCPL